MSRIFVGTFRRFESQPDQVALSFRYDADLVALLKMLNRERRQLGAGGSSVLGWQPSYKCWFVNPCVWQAVRRALVQAGHELVEEPALAHTAADAHGGA